MTPTFLAKPAQSYASYFSMRALQFLHDPASGSKLELCNLIPTRGPQAQDQYPWWAYQAKKETQEEDGRRSNAGKMDRWGGHYDKDGYYVDPSGKQSQYLEFRLRSFWSIVCTARQRVERRQFCLWHYRKFVVKQQGEKREKH